MALFKETSLSFFCEGKFSFRFLRDIRVKLRQKIHKITFLFYYSLFRKNKPTRFYSKSTRRFIIITISSLINWKILYWIHFFIDRIVVQLEWWKFNTNFDLVFTSFSVIINNSNYKENKSIEGISWVSNETGVFLLFKWTE